MAFAAAVGGKVNGGEVIVLVSDLGGGKTAFVKGLAHGMGSQDDVSSPSFTISNQYQAGTLTLYHFDLYRLQEPGIMRDELAETVADEQAVIVVEWGEIVADVLPAEHVTIRIAVQADDTRILECTYPESLQYLFPENT